MTFAADYDADIQLIAAPSPSVDEFLATLGRRVGDRLRGQPPAILGPLDLSTTPSPTTRRARLAVILAPARDGALSPADDLPPSLVQQINGFVESLPAADRDADSIRNRLFLVLIDEAQAAPPHVNQPQAADPESWREAIRGLPAYDLRSPAPPLDPLNFKQMALEQLTTAVSRRLAESRRGDSARVRRRTVFLAEPAREVAAAAQMLRSYLEDHGYRVTPVERLSQTAAGSLERFASALAEARLFVQLLGVPEPAPSPFSTESPLFLGGYESWQHAQAVSSGLPILRWRAPAAATASTSSAVDSASSEVHVEEPSAAKPPAMALDEKETPALRDEASESRVASTGVIVCDLERFRALVVDELRTSRLAFRQTNSTASANSAAEAVVLIAAGPSDEAWGESLREQIRAWGVETESEQSPPPQDSPNSTDSVNSTLARAASTLITRFVPKMVFGNLSLEREARRYSGFRGAIVVHGSADNEWLERQVFACRRLSLELTRVRPGFAFWSANAAATEDRWLPPCFQRLQLSNPRALAAFLQSLAESHA